MTDMFCFQCQQTAGNKGCIRTGVCGKQPTTANLQDKLVYELISLAETMVEKDMRTKEADRLFIDGLFTTLTNVNFDNAAIENMIQKVRAEKERLVPDCSKCQSSCGKTDEYIFGDSGNAFPCCFVFFERMDDAGTFYFPE